MFIKRLKIETGRGDVIRYIKFHRGINLIVDETPGTSDRLTGNNVGKTTVLKLVDYCFGADKTIIYADSENQKEVYHLVKNLF